MKKLKMQESETVELKKSLAELKQGLVSIEVKRQSLLEKKAWFSKKPQRNPRETPKKLSSLS